MIKKSIIISMLEKYKLIMVLRIRFYKLVKFDVFYKL
jgi:hypothetical protein